MGKCVLMIQILHRNSSDMNVLTSYFAMYLEYVICESNGGTYLRSQANHQRTCIF